MSDWLVVTSAFGIFEKIFVKKVDVEGVSTIKVDGSSQTCLTAKVRGKRRTFHILESAKEIWFRLS